MSAGRDRSGPALSVVHLTTVHPVHDTRILYRECRTLAQAGHSVVLIAPHDKPKDEIAGVEVRGIRRIKSRLLRRLISPIRAGLIAARTRADVYHIHDPELIPVALVLKWLTRARIVYDVHEYYSEIIAATSRPRGLARLQRPFWHYFVEWLPARLFDLTVFPTERLRAEYAPPATSVTVRNLPSATEVPADARARTADLDYDLVFVGTVSPPRLKFMLTMARIVAERRPSFRFLFLGIAPSSVAWARQNVDAAFLTAHVTFVNHVPFPEVHRYLSRSAIGYNYHPTEKRFDVAIPMKVFEYMFMGIPSVSSALPELADLVKPSGAVLLVPGNDPGLHAAAVVDLLDRPDQAHQMGRSGRQYILEHLNWERSEAPRLLEAYQRLCAGRRC